MRRLLAPLIALFAAGSALAQGDEVDWRMPFRTPANQIDPPEDVFRELRIMQSRAMQRAVEKSFDEDGVEVCNDDAWREARARLNELKQVSNYNIPRQDIEQLRCLKSSDDIAREDGMAPEGSTITFRVALKRQAAVNRTHRVCDGFDPVIQRLNCPGLIGK